MDLHSLSPEHGGQRLVGVGIKVFQQLLRSLNQGDSGSKPLEELSKLDGHRSSAQHDHRLGKLCQLESLIAGDISGALEREEGWLRHLGAGSDHERACCDPTRRGAGELQSVCIDKSRGATKKGESTVLQLL